MGVNSNSPYKKKAIKKGHLWLRHMSPKLVVQFPPAIPPPPPPSPFPHPHSLFLPPPFSPFFLFPTSFLFKKIIFLSFLLYFFFLFPPPPIFLLFFSSPCFPFLLSTQIFPNVAPLMGKKKKRNSNFLYQKREREKKPTIAMAQWVRHRSTK